MVKYSTLEQVSEKELAELELPVLIKNKELMLKMFPSKILMFRCLISPLVVFINLS